jgi:hypothetical protein
LAQSLCTSSIPRKWNGKSYGKPKSQMSKKRFVTTNGSAAVAERRVR